MCQAIRVAAGRDYARQNVVQTGVNLLLSMYTRPLLLSQCL